jgi:ADP-ribose pyrophosphatase YjhB (NUDIX family)
MGIPVKHSVAVAIFNQDRILAIRRSDTDDELPGIWGLPAGTKRGTETVEQVIDRIGEDKLGVHLTPIRKLASGRQDRPEYRLEMELWEVAMEGVPGHPEWRWASRDLFEQGAASGSLCCRLVLLRPDL